MILMYKILTANTVIQLPLGDIEGELMIDWGDMSEDTVATVATLTHTYNDAGLYTVLVSAGEEGASIGRFGLDYQVKGNHCLIALKSWGDFNITSLKKAFASCKNLVKVPTTLPCGVTSLAGMFYDTDLFNQDISGWDVSTVLDMSSMFYCARAFNQDISHWNIANVTTIDGMFIGATNFKQDTSHWRVKCTFTNIG